ncbi:HTH_Tnp_Tc3_2 domain-containing protein [Trichonephila clavipes]|nr:HTH_Tnp_Tc3_2 domain-containing protein [Trichonephila clavipes]
MSSGLVPAKTRFVGERYMLNLSRAQQFSRLCGGVVKRGSASSGVVLVTRHYFKITRSGAKCSQEDFGKRNVPGKRARRHFSQLSEFERGLIIGMKTAGRVAGQVDHSKWAVRNCWKHWTREGTQARKTGSGANRKTTRREDRRIVWQALVAPTVTRSAVRADVGVANVPQTISRDLAEANLKSKRPFRALPLTPEHRQLRLQ